MRKLFLFLLLLTAPVLGQTAYTGVTRNITTASQYCSNSTRCTIIGTGAAFHQLTWNVSGTLSACSVRVDSSANGITWGTGDIIAAQTCTSNGQTISTSNVVNYVRVNVTTITPIAGANLTVNLSGFVNLPSGGGNLSGTLTSPRVPYASAATTLTDDSLHTWDATNHRLAIGGAIDSASVAAFNITGATVSTLPNYGAIETHVSFQIGQTMYGHSDTGFRGTALNMFRSRGTQASPTVPQSGDIIALNQYGGWNGTTYAITASKQVGANENWSGTNLGTDVIYQVTRITSTAPAEVYRLTSTSSSQSLFRFATGTIVQFGTDLDLQRNSAGLLNLGTGASASTNGRLRLSSVTSAGTKFTTNGGCNEGTTVGGASAGKFTVGQNTACTVVITMGDVSTSVNGWTCVAYDQTAVPAVAIRQTASSTTTCSLLMTVATNDVITFAAIGY